MNDDIAVNPVLPLVGRILISAVFLVVGIRSVVGFDGFVRYMTNLGFPAPAFMGMLAIAVMLAGAVLLIIGYGTRWAGWLLIAFLIVAIFSAHRFWEVADPAQYANQLNHFLKDTALIGAMLYIIAFGPGRMSVGKR